MTPTTTYSDKSQFGKRSYFLFPDRIVLRHSDTVQVEGESTFALCDLRATYDSLSVRGPFFMAGVWIMMIAWPIYWGLIELTNLDPLGYFPGFFLAMGAVGLFVALAGLKRQRLVRFQTKAGVPAFDIFREGPRRHEFDSFLTRLEAGIRASTNGS